MALIKNQNFIWVVIGGLVALSLYYFLNSISELLDNYAWYRDYVLHPIVILLVSLFVILFVYVVALGKLKREHVTRILNILRSIWEWLGDNSTQVQAVSVVALVTITVIYAFFVGISVLDNKEIVSLMRQEHAVTFRPYLAIEPYRGERLNNSFIVKYKITNVGRLPAKLVSISGGPALPEDITEPRGGLIFPGQWLGLPHTINDINNRLHVSSRIKVEYTYGSHSGEAKQFFTRCLFDIDLEKFNIEDGKGIISAIEIKECEMDNLSSMKNVV